jgi:4-hydroxybutyrate dehydrogenase/sulfolactaldehyde 3-reductase
MAKEFAKIAFLGLGNMGGPMARNLAKAGYAVTGYDIAPAALARAVEGGVEDGKSVADALSGADAVLSILSDTPDVEACLLGEDSLSGVAPGALVMEMSTIAPATTDRLATKAARAGLSFLDAPVGRAPAQAESGELLFLVGGEAAVLERARPLFDVMGTTLHHCGGTGTGIRTKLVNNYLSQTTCQISAEAVALGLKMGLSLDTLLPIMTGSLASNQYLASYWPSKVLVGDIEPGFAIRLSAKDIGLAVDMAEEAGAVVATGKAAAERIRAAAGEMGDQDVSALLIAACAAAGTEPPTS